MEYSKLSSSFFENVPKDFFNILSSPNKELYLSALFVVRDAFEKRLSINKKELKEQILISLENSIEKADLTTDFEDEDMEDREEVASLSGKASFLLSKLIKKGWLFEEDAKEGFEKDIIIPDYASDFLETLYRETRPKDELADSDVFSSYAVLKMAGNEDGIRKVRTTQMALKVAHDNARRLERSFRNLYFFIGKYYKEHLKDERVLDMLEARFKEGGEQSVIDAYYHPLKTSDSIALYGSDILKFVKEIDKNPELIKEIAKLNTSSSMDDDDKIMEIRSLIDDICSVYDDAGKKIDMITQKNADYNRRFTQAVIHNLRSDHSIVSKIVKIIKHVDENEVFFKGVNDKIATTTCTFIDEKSLRSEQTRKSTNDDSKILLRPHHEKNKEHTQKFLKQSFGGYTMSDARKYVKDKMHGRHKMETSEIIKEIENFGNDDYTLLIMASLYGFSNGEYIVKKSDRQIPVGNYLVPDMTFEVKENKL